MPKSPREKLVVKVLLGILGLFVVFFAYRMVAGGGEGAKASPPAINQGGGQTGAKPTVPKKKPGKKKQASELVFTGVDPFEPLIAPAPSPTAPAADPGALPTAAPAQPGATLVVQGTTLTLVDLPSQDGVQKAHVLVNGILYQLIPGDEFGDGFTLTSISPPCADFSWVSESFRLCLPE